jgi:hypothetical protein
MIATNLLAYLIYKYGVESLRRCSEQQATKKNEELLEI